MIVYISNSLLNKLLSIIVYFYLNGCVDDYSINTYNTTSPSVFRLMFKHMKHHYHDDDDETPSVAPPTCLLPHSQLDIPSVALTVCDTAERLTRVVGE